jgi:Xaa-Pro aminopeptidase
VSSEELAPLSVAGRLDRLRRRFADAVGESGPIGALVVTTPANIRWLTGFTGSAGVLCVTGERALLTTDGRYRAQSTEQLTASGAADQVSVTIGAVKAQRSELSGLVGPGAVVGLEADNVTWASERAWDELLGASELVPVRNLVEDLRVVKDAGEILRMERAASIADLALESVLPRLAAGGGMTEARFAAALDHAMREQGAEDRAFETIVASGENSAKPHARPGGRPIGPGEPVVVDFGAVFDGYRSDMTRTFVVGGEPSGELARIFEVVTDAQRAGVAVVGPGVEAGTVDRTCRLVIEEAGWAERFEHGTGHGVGLDIHEAPSVGPGSTAILAPGAVVTVEPGVYLPGTGGVRIEDTLVVTEDGSRSLTQFPKEVALR